MIKPAGANNALVGPLAIGKALIEAVKNNTEMTIWDQGGPEKNIKITKKTIEDLYQDLLNFRKKHEKEDLQQFKAELEGPTAALKLGKFSPLDMNILRTYLDNNMKYVS